MKEVNFKVFKKDRPFIEKIINRACGMYKGIDNMSLEMDIVATNANGMKLDFEKLLEFDDFNFSHDISGIINHINRETGEIENFFVPRCSFQRKDKY